MPVIDVETLSAPLDEGSPCGEDLEYAGVTALEELATTKPERQIGTQVIPAEEPDWKAVRRDAEALFAQTRDLRVATRLALALLATEGWPGWSDGLALVRTLLVTWWDDLHPRLDPADGFDPTIRVSTLGLLADPATTLRMLRTTPLAGSRQLGRVCYRDVLFARGELQAREDESPPDAATIDAIFHDAGAESVGETLAAIDAALADAQSVDRLLEEKDGGRPLESLVSLLKDIRRVVAAHAASDSASPGEIADGEQLLAPSGVPAASPGAPVPSGPMSTRADAVAAIDQAIAWFERHEPSSPVPILLTRARRLVGKSFLEIVDDLVPAGREQLDTLRGRSDEALAEGNSDE